VEKLLARAAAPSDTLSLARNLASVGVYVLHGDQDESVPVNQARRMRQVLGEFHPDFAYHEQPGARHWWGSGCVDWPPLFAFLQQRKIPSRTDVHRVDFITASPGVTAQARWATIEAQLHAMVPSAVHLEVDSDHRRFRGTTENVARLALDVEHALDEAKAERPITVELDGQTLSGLTPIHPRSGEGSKVVLTRSGGTWSATGSPASLSEKGPHRMGPFKEAFRNRFLLVFGTRGTPEENAWGVNRARLDAETFWYRGNGSIDVVPDTAFLDPARAGEFRDRNVILYGHSESNGAWPALLGDSPVQVQRGQVRIGRRTTSGNDLACLFYRPRPGSDRAAVGVVSGSGMIGLRLTERLPYFVSGVGYPDCLLLSARTLTDGAKGVIAAGYFGLDWGIESGEFAWRD
jgi:hypothetical protein